MPAEPATLPYGDVEIVGRGPDDRPMLVGIELKTVADVLACIGNGRFDEQLRGMHDLYEVRWLLVEGRVNADARGDLHVYTSGRFQRPFGARTFKYTDLLEWLNGVSIRGGVNVWFAEDKDEAVSWLAAQHKWWRKPWDQHTTGTGLYAAPLASEGFERPTLAWRTAATFPGLGSGRARAAAHHFGTVRSMVNAPVDEWASIEGIGKKTAARVVAAMEAKD